MVAQHLLELGQRLEKRCHRTLLVQQLGGVPGAFAVDPQLVQVVVRRVVAVAPVQLAVRLVQRQPFRGGQLVQVGPRIGDRGLLGGLLQFGEQRAVGRVVEFGDQLVAAGDPLAVQAGDQVLQRPGVRIAELGGLVVQLLDHHVVIPDDAERPGQLLDVLPQPVRRGAVQRRAGSLEVRAQPPGGDPHLVHVLDVAAAPAAVLVRLDVGDGLAQDGADGVGDVGRDQPRTAGRGTWRRQRGVIGRVLVGDRLRGASAVASIGRPAGPALDRSPGWPARVAR